MKKVLTLFLCGIPLFVAVTPLHSQDYKTEQRSKAIHVVYDDSESMIMDDENGPAVYRDRWGQAKYAMEVFAAMLEEKDSMAVYFMSDYDVFGRGRLDTPPRITTSGSESAATRVEKVHNTLTWAGATPFDAVQKAYADLKTAYADEKWLVVLTDGEFNRLDGQRKDPKTDPIDIDGFFSQYARESGVKVVLFAMGEIVAEIKPNPGRGIYFEHARDSNEILGKLTFVCNLIFNRNRLSFTHEARREISFDIPMTELLVFAQGADVRINDMKGGNTYSPSEQPVNVRYSEVAADNYKNDPRVRVSRDLTGAVAKFRNIPKGTYTLDVIGAKTVEVYYKPVVRVDIRLKQGPLEIRPNKDGIPHGKYRVEYGIVNEDGKFFESELLGGVVYDVTVQNGGNIIPIQASGSTVDLEEGDFKIYVKARFLDINTAEGVLPGNVYYVTLLQRILDWIRKFWFIFWPLVALLLGLLLFWLLWGRKKRFPRYMSGKPAIQVESDGNTTTRYGRFRIKSESKWLPLCPETGTIDAAADGIPLPQLKVRALGGNSMELINTGDFSADKLGGIEFYINDQELPEGSTREKRMSCTAEIKSVYHRGGTTTTYTCLFAKQGKKRRK